MNRDKQDALIEAWKQSIDVQKHFNDLILKIRERAITVIGAGLVATAFLVKEQYTLAQPIRYVHLASAFLFLLIVILIILTILILDKKLTLLAQSVSSNNKLDQLLEKLFPKRLAALRANTRNEVDDKIIKRWGFLLGIPYLVIFCTYLILRVNKDFEKSNLYSPVVESPSLGGLTLISLAFVWIAFYLLDRFWYHRLLKGAVNHGIEAEKSLKREFTEFNLGENISKESSIYISYKFNFLKKFRIDSNSKLDIYYFSIFLTLLSIGVIMLKQPNEILKGGEKNEYSINLVPLPIDSINRIKKANDSLIKVNKVLENRVVELETRNRIDTIIRRNFSRLSPPFPSDSI